MHKNRKGKYAGLQDGEGGRYGVLSVTNPNYIDEEILCSHRAPSNVVDICDGDRNDDSVTTTTTTNNDILDIDSSFVKMNYNEDILVERTENKDNLFNINGDLINALPIKDLSANPLPESV